VLRSERAPAAVRVRPRGVREAWPAPAVSPGPHRGCRDGGVRRRGGSRVRRTIEAFAGAA